MLKYILGFLILANGVLLAQNAGYLDVSGSEGHEPRRAANALNAQQIRLVPGAAAPAVMMPVPPVSAAVSDAGTAPSTPVVPGATVTTGVPGTPGTPAPAPPAVAAAAGVGTQCVEIGNFDSADARRFESQLQPLNLGPKLSQRSIQESNRFIVYIPALPDRESAERKAGELRRLGVEDFYLFSDNSDLRRSISLGVFKSEEAANQHLATLVRKGVRSARVLARGAASGRVAFQLRGLDQKAQAELGRIGAAFPKQASRACMPA